MEEIVKAVVGELRPAFQANGGDLEIREVTQNLVKIDLVIGPTTCRECLLPPQTIEDMLAGLLNAQLGREIKVVVEEAGSGGV